MGSKYGNAAFNAVNHVVAMYEPLTFDCEANLTAAISDKCSSGETSAAKAAQPPSAQTPASSSTAKDKPVPVMKKAEQGQKAPTK
jgi:hypothetical protein